MRAFCGQLRGKLLLKGHVGRCVHGKGHSAFPCPYWSPYWIYTEHPTYQWSRTSILRAIPATHETSAHTKTKHPDYVLHICNVSHVDMRGRFNKKMIIHSVGDMFGSLLPSITPLKQRWVPGYFPRPSPLNTMYMSGTWDHFSLLQRSTRQWAKAPLKKTKWFRKLMVTKILRPCFGKLLDFVNWWFFPRWLLLKHFKVLLQRSTRQWTKGNT